MAARATRQQTRITEWITSGRYAIAVEVDATVFSDRPGEPYLAPETVRFLDQVARDARAGDLEALKKAGKVFVQLDQAG